MYRREYYNTILQGLTSYYCLDTSKIKDWQWIAWRTQIKRLFEENITIREILDALPEASQKKQWPLNTALFHRIQDVILKNRYEKEKIINIDKGTESIKELLKNKGYPQAKA